MEKKTNLVAYTSMDLEKYEKLLKEQQKNYENKLWEIKNEVGKGFKAEDYSSKIERKIIFNIDGLIHIEGKIESSIRFLDKKLFTEIHEFEKIFVANPFYNEEFQNIDVILQKMEQELQDKKINFYYSDSDNDSLKINILESFKEFLYTPIKDDPEWQLINFKTGKLEPCSLFLGMMDKFGKIKCNTIVFNKNGWQTEVLAYWDKGEIEFNSWNDLTGLNEVKYTPDFKDIFERGLLSKEAYSLLLNDLLKKFPGTFDEYKEKIYKPKNYNLRPKLD